MSAAVDLIKGLAILAVLWQHTVPAEVTDDVVGNLWIRTAVPVFIVLMGLNLTRSVQQRGIPPTGPHLREYLERRLARIAVPFLLVLATGYVIALARGGIDANYSLLVGGLPVNAPGNYFIPALIGLVLLFPLLVRAFGRHPALTVAACLAVDAAFEVAVLSGLGKDSGIINSLVYSGNPLRWLGAFALGMWLAADWRPLARRNRWLVGLAAASALYLAVEQARPESFGYFPDNFVEVTNLLAAPWAALLVAFGLQVLPVRVSSAPARALATLGAASYHVYLVQMLVIGVVVGGLAGAALSIAGGLAYFWLLPGRLGGAPSGSPGRTLWASPPSTADAR